MRWLPVATPLSFIARSHLFFPNPEPKSGIHRKEETSEREEGCRLRIQKLTFTLSIAHIFEDQSR